MFGFRNSFQASYDDLMNVIRRPLSSSNLNQQVIKSTKVRPSATGAIPECKLDIADYAAVSTPSAPVVITWDDVTVTTNMKGSEPMTLINHIGGTITGGLWAIMGPSGSGKVEQFYAIVK